MTSEGKARGKNKMTEWVVVGGGKKRESGRGGKGQIQSLHYGRGTREKRTLVDE